MDSAAPPLRNNLPEEIGLARSGNSFAKSFASGFYMMWGVLLTYHFTVQLSDLCCFVIFNSFKHFQKISGFKKLPHKEDLIILL